MDLEIGSTIGDYQVVGILGAGGMGKVYKVRNVISDRVEAMKVLLPDLAAMPDLADRFLREIKLQASLDHPNIAQLHTAVRAGNQLLMVMEFVEGQTLEQRLKQGPLPLAQALDYVGQVLGALDFAHSHGVIHRDIKPANMMLTPAGVVKLMDFGIAKGTTDHKLTVTGMTIGSVYYMSPEQIQGAANLDARADLYSVGVTLYELVTGKRPFDGDSQYAIMAAHLERTPVPPITLDPRLPQSLNDVILMSVAKDPNARFQTGAAFRNALAAVAASLQAPTVPSQAAAAPAAPARPAGHRWVWMGLGGVAAAAAIVAMIELAPWKPTKAAAPIPAPPAVTAAAAPVQSVPQPESTPATESTPAPEPTPAPAAVKPGAVKQSVVTQPSAVAKPSPMPPAQSKAAAQLPPVQAPPVQQPQAQPQSQSQAATVVPPPAPAGPSRAQIMEAREHFAKLQVRAGSIHGSLENLQRSMQAQGVGLSGKFTGPAGLMDTYLRSADAALNQADLAAAKDYADKAERQIEILEKLLNL